MKIPLIFNDKAGVLKVAHHVGERQLRQASEAAGLDVDLVATRSPEETRAAVRRYAEQGAARVAVAGGDGTVALAVQALAHTETALGIIPTGTANNFAAALRLPLDLPGALRVMSEGEVIKVDLGKVGEHYFTESAGVGLFADALSLYGLERNKNLPRALYTFARILTSYRARRLTLYADGELHSERAVLCEVMNTYRTGAALPLAPEAKLTDGRLEVVVMGDLQLGELWTYYRAVRSQLHRSLPKVHTFSAKEVRIEAGSKLNVHLDEKYLTTTPVTVSVDTAALRVLVERL